MMKFSITLGLIVLLGTVATAQYKKGLKALNKGDFETALNAFEADLSNKDNKPVAEYGLAKLFFDKAYEEYDPAKAHDYVATAQKSLRKVSSKSRKKIQKEGVSSGVLRKMQRDMTNVVYSKAIEANDVEVYNNFLERCNMATKPQVETASKNRNIKALQDAKKIGKYSAYQDFIKKYHKSSQQLNPELAIKAEKLLFESFITEKGWPMYFSFTEQYPKNVYSRDSAGGFDMVKIIRKTDLVSFKNYYRAYPTSPFLKFAKDKMFEIVMKDDDIREYDFFVRNFPDYERNPELWKVFYGLYIQKKGQKGVLEFQKNYPGYPNPEEVRRDVKAYEKTIETPAFEKTKKSKKTADYEAFIKRYPESEFLPQLETPMHEALLYDGTFKGCKWFLQLYPTSKYRQKVLKVLYGFYAADGEISSLDRFYNEYPDFKETELLKKDMEIAEKGWELGIEKGFDNSKTNAYENYIREAAPKELAYVALQRMIEQDVKDKNWALAIAKVERYGSWFGEGHPKIAGLLKILKARSQSLNVNCFGENVNTSTEEYVPIISVDDQYLYFCRWDMTNENIYVAEFDGNEWGPAQAVDDLNTPNKNEGPMAISADNSEMIIFVEGDLYYSTQSSQGWEAPKAYPYPINSTSWDADAMLSSDGRAMIFVSRRKEVLGMQHTKWFTYHGDGFGNIDIFVSIKDDNGKWGRPINLGSTINTPFAERTPFLHPDMKTLYFSSDGHGGLGRMDVFKTTRLDDSWTNWSKPINLGKDINTAENDWGYKISTDGATTYFAIKNEMNGKASQDICTIELPEEFRPEKVSTISGHLMDADGNPIEADIVWEDLQTGAIVGRLRSDPKTGKFFITLPNDRQYSYFVSKDGFFPKANNIDLRDKGETLKVDEKLEMVRIEEMIEQDIALPLKNLFFETNKYNIKSSSFPELNRLANLVKDYNLTVEISGHTDNKGSDNDNMLLSQNRADAVREYLTKQGCDANKIKAVGYGETRPIRNNDTAKGRAQNRRVEVRFKKSE